MITSGYRGCLHELGWIYAEREHRPWYVVDRDGEIGLTADLHEGDEIISTYEVD